MKKLGIIVCSTSGMDYLPQEADIHTLRLTVSFDKKEYVDYTDIKAQDFYEKMIASPNADIHTSQISAGVFAEKYEELKQKGYEQLLVVTLSSKLSGTYQAANLAKEMVPGIEISVFDTKYVSYVEAYSALVALKLHKNGLKMAAIIEKLTEIRDNTRVYILVDTLKYLVKNGRLKATAGFIGTLLKIKPLLHFTKEGTLETFEKIRTTAKAQKRLVELFLSDIKDRNVLAFIPYTNNLESAEEIQNEIKQHRPDVEVMLVPLTPVVGAHAGPGTLGLGYISL